MENFDSYPLLKTISSPEDVKRLSLDDLSSLAAEIRRYLSFRVRENGGHLASNLGVVELTLAMHRVFDTPIDHFIFDVGHQSYVHKLLTGRKEQFDTLRCPGGLSGFTKRCESAHDAFGAGHSSTAISAAVGMAEADRLAGKRAHTVAVVGDGALTGGLAYEGLNNCRPDLSLVVVVNENEMSISPNTGRLSEHLSRIRTSKKYIKAKTLTKKTLGRVPILGFLLYKLLQAGKRALKRILYKENLFEHMGLRYCGPLDGNDLAGMIAALEYAKQLQCSVVLHVKTKKGLGDAEAEANPDIYHGVAPRGKQQTAPTFSQQFGEALCRAAERDSRICAITAAMSHGTGLEPFREAFADRFFDVGIAEGHAVTFAAGLSAGGQRPVVAVYSTFLQRAYDNLLHDAALQGLPLVLAVDRAGFNAADGATHHGVFDVSLLSAIDGVRIYAPVTGAGIAASLNAAWEQGGIAAIRYPSGTEDEALKAAFYPTGVLQTRAPGLRIYDTGACPMLTVLTHGRIAAEALKAANALQATGVFVRVVLCEYLAPYPSLAKEAASCLSGNAVVFYEEEVRSGGFGENLSRALLVSGALADKPYRIVAAESGFATPRAGQTVWQAAGVDADSLQAAIKDLINMTKGDKL